MGLQARVAHLERVRNDEQSVCPSMCRIYLVGDQDEKYDLGPPPRCRTCKKTPGLILDIYGKYGQDDPASP